MLWTTARQLLGLVQDHREGLSAVPGQQVATQRGAAVHPDGEGADHDAQDPGARACLDGDGVLLGAEHGAHHGHVLPPVRSGDLGCRCGGQPQALVVRGGFPPGTYVRSQGVPVIEVGQAVPDRDSDVRLVAVAAAAAAAGVGVHVNALHPVGAEPHRDLMPTLHRPHRSPRRTGGCSGRVLGGADHREPPLSRPPKRVRVAGVPRP